MNINFKDIFIIIVLSYILYNVYYTVEYLEDEKNKNNNLEDEKNNNIILYILLSIIAIVSFCILVYFGYKKYMESKLGATEPSVTDLRGKVPTASELSDREMNNCKFNCDKIYTDFTKRVDCYKTECGFFQTGPGEME